MANDQVQIAITGVGIICANGQNIDQFWRNVTAGQSGIRLVTTIDTAELDAKLGGEVDGYLPEDYFSTEELQHLDRAGQFAVIAAREAVQRAGLDIASFDPYRLGIVLGTCLGGLRSGEAFHEQWITQGLEHAEEHLLMKYPMHAPCDNIAHDLGLKGPRSVIANACAAGTNSIGYAADMIRMGTADIMLTGGVDPLARLSYSGFNSLQALSAGACAPYSTSAGLNLGEGGAILVLERMDVALQRGATIIAEVLSYDLSADAYHQTAPEPGGAGALRSMKGALRRSGVTVEDVSYINGHGTGTPANDSSEPKAMRALIQDQHVPISSTKSMVGHMLGAAGAAESIVSALAIQDGYIPPTINFNAADQKFDLDFIPNEGRDTDVQVALSNSFAFGGNNATILLGKSKEPSGESLSSARKKVLITGVGGLAGNAATIQQLQELIDRGESGISPIRLFDSNAYQLHEAGQVPELAYAKMINPSLLRKMDTISKQAVAAVKMALLDAGIVVNRANQEQIGVIFATGTGPIETVDAFNRAIIKDGIKAANAKLFPNTVTNAPAGHIGLNFNIKGPTSTIAAGGTSFINALYYANAMIQLGQCKTVLVVSSDEFNEPLLAGYQRVSGYLSKSVIRPFDKHRDGAVLGSGSFCYIVESEEAALERNANVRAELKGFGMTSDVRLLGGINPRGTEWADSFRAALHHADLSASDIDYVAAAACGHRIFDYAEAHALNRVFAGSVPVSAPKSYFGETHSTAGAIGLWTALNAMQTGRIPATLHLNEPLQGVDVDFVTSERQEATVRHAMISSFAYGGSYNSLIVGRYE
ncbi:beta-ketoacyl-[acyl-carrier-protein] synthase family protein [Paenibacillus arenosi]|uniref:Beta-ketoacyl-ACP synthase II n=1 Tax=Paenibacillus arenosi TaxID=2774142 RepID=A0ABR9AVS1_9BACL|nr:beta-ketoacyl-[acyl-carrier-protein] synthase family protein [Paenibacillus arenosi]MBD8498179.1 beta-ketoacyl-ACP synthase II [Paenibacillus arenosi]